jgi:class 3 adenylate cyclase
MPPSEARELVTGLFADLASSTELAVRQDPEQLRSLLSVFLEEMMNPIRAFSGVVEKYAGDAIMTVFAVPQVHKDDAERTVRVAVAMRRAGVPARSTFAGSYFRMPTSRCDMPLSSFWSEP